MIDNLADEFDKIVMALDIPDDKKDLLFSIIGDIDATTYQWRSFLDDAPRDILVAFMLDFELEMQTYYEEVLDPLGIDYFDAPMLHHFFNRNAGVDLKGKYQRIGEEE